MAIELKFEAEGWREFRLDLDRFADNVTNAEPVFEEMSMRFRMSMAEQFKKRGGHTGPRWAPLSPAYAAWKAKAYPGKPIMELTGRLKASFLIPGAPGSVHEISGTSMTVGSAVPYGPFHQRGTPIMPQRELIGPPTMYEQRRYAKMLQGWIVDRNVKAE